MIYLDASALVKFVKRERESAALREWRLGLAQRTVLLTSELARLEIARALYRAGADLTRVPYYVGQALRGIHLVVITQPVLARAAAYTTPRLGSLDAIHLASAEPLQPELDQFVSYDDELNAVASGVGLPTTVPRDS